MEKVGISIQHAYDINTNKVEYSEILVRQYRGINGAYNILKYVKENNIEKEFDLNVLENLLIYVKSKESIHFPIAVNFCSNTIICDNIHDDIKNLIDKYDIDYNNIAIEIHEDTDLNDSRVVNNIRELKKLGLLIALDDFGISKSNLSNIVEFNFDVIKLDKVFADHLNDKSFNGLNKSEVILKYIKMLANELNIKTIVEGIETQEHLDVVSKLGFNYVQGYFYEKPIPLNFNE